MVDKNPSVSGNNNNLSSPNSASRKTTPKLLRKNSRALTGTRFTETQRFEIDIDEWHTREAVVKTGSRQVEVDSKSTCCEFYLSPFGTDFNLILSEDVKLPDLGGLERTDAIKQLGEAINLTDYRTNFISFWILETLLVVLRESQTFRMSSENQKMSVIWIIYILKTIMFFGFKRREMFSHLDDLFEKAGVLIHESGIFPNPYSLLNEKDYLEQRKSSSPSSRKKSVGTKINPAVHLDSTLRKDGKEERSASKTSKQSRSAYRRSHASQKSLRFRKLKSLSTLSLGKKAPEFDAEFYFLIDQIYEIFASRFKYEVIYRIFSKPQEIQTQSVCQSILKPKEIRSADSDRLHSASKKSIGKSGKAKSTPSEKRKVDKTKTPKEEIIQKVMKLLNEPLPTAEEKEPLPISLPYLQPLNDAVDRNFFLAHSLPPKTAKKQLVGKFNHFSPKSAVKKNAA